MTLQPLSKKHEVIIEVYNLCKSRVDMVFDNDDVRKACSRVGFGNPFDATKWDNSALLPGELSGDDVFIVHLGRGRHRFVSGINVGYHRFEPVPVNRQYQWPYRRSILNNVNTSESNILSVGFNQRIIHDFIYEDIAASPKVYGSHRTHIQLQYRVGEVHISASRLQVEIDFTTEYQSHITVFEGKNGEPVDFNVFQLFNPVRYYRGLVDSGKISEASVDACYLVRHEDRLRLYLYGFADLQDPGSIELLRNAEYMLVQR